MSAGAREYWNHRNELSEYDGIILKGTQIIIPQSIRNEMLVILHESHFEIEKKKHATWQRCYVLARYECSD